MTEQREKRELTFTSSDKLSTQISQGDIGAVLQPLIKEIHLFDSFVAGTSFLKDPTVLDRLSSGQTLLLEREQNKFDDNAVVILTEAREKVGYIPEKDNMIFARLMDAGKLLRAKIIAVEKKHDFSKISIGIYLVDI